MERTEVPAVGELVSSDVGGALEGSGAGDALAPKTSRFGGGLYPERRDSLTVP